MVSGQTWYPGSFAVALSPALAAALLFAGCNMLPVADYQALKSQNQALAERNRAQAAQLENLQIHTRNTEDQLMRAEQDLAIADEQRELDHQQLANYQVERQRLHEQFQNLMDHRSKLPPSVGGRLAEISAKYPSLRFDPKTGISKLDTDILFDVGTADLKPGAEQVLGELAAVLKSNEARDLKIMVVGHTDDQPIGRKPASRQVPRQLPTQRGPCLGGLRRCSTGSAWPIRGSA